ncbi:MAG: hypothetical protein HY537_15810 [Deltaproteobacteria bacterium]|nr:hypothetical protein [Deltaproteobacteria bacterium]
MAIYLRFFFIILLITSVCTAKNLEGRWGAGLVLQDFNNLAALSFKHHFSQHLGVQFLGGFDTQDSSNALILGGKVTRNAYLEENLNFYIGLGGYIISDKNNTENTSTGFELDGLVGAEFFLSGLPNLGFQFEVGAAMRSLRRVSFKTVGGTFAGAGIHYYF